MVKGIFNIILLGFLSALTIYKGAYFLNGRKIN